MFKCNVCQKLYNSKVDYCDCGNDVFEEIHDSVLSDNKNFTINMQQVLSGVIFASCLALSCRIWVGTSTEPATVPSVSTNQEKVKKTHNIPTIDKIWDNTPVSTVDKTPFGIYKSELQKALYANLEETEIVDEGRCEIEFKVNRNGKLTNRRIYKEKGGSQFNNLVIKMMKQTSSVRIPPDGYEGSKFRAKVYTQDGVVKILVR